MDQEAEGRVTPRLNGRYHTRIGPAVCRENNVHTLRGVLVLRPREAGAFRFLEPGRLVDNDLRLTLVERVKGHPMGDLVPTYIFEMRHFDSGDKLGTISLRIGNTDYIVMYMGHIGYNVVEQHRGNRYAARSCQLVLPLAKAHGLSPLWITCNPDNWPSRRTCERLDAEMIEIVPLPKDTEMYRRGERHKCRYRLDLQ